MDLPPESSRLHDIHILQRLDKMGNPIFSLKAVNPVITADGITLNEVVFDLC